MPTYEYQCKECGNVQEQMHGITATPKVTCEICSGDCERLFSLNKNFVLKGNDWPSQSFRMKDQMKKKNDKMKTKMIERERSGEGATKLADIK